MMTPEAVIIESMFSIVNKEGVKVPFRLNDAQRKLDDAFTGRDLVPKSRQRGVTRYVLGRFTAACLGMENESCAVISHEQDSTQRLLSQCRFYLNNLAGGLSAVTERDSMNLITFPKTNSMLYIGTAGSRKFGRGDTIRRLHCSEYAYWPNPKELLGGLLQAVPSSGEVWIESTGNGKGNDYHRRCMRAYSKQSQWTCHFLSWIDDDTCRIPLDAKENRRILDNLDVQLEEDLLVKNFGCDGEQLIWRRFKLEELDYDLRLFKQEYPSTIDECFQAATGGIFTHVNYEPTERWRDVGQNLWLLDNHPNQFYHYVIGADVSAGVERDNSCIQVFCLETREQVGEYVYNRVAPDAFGLKVLDLGRRFNNAYIVVESNNHGIATLQELRRSDYPRFLIHATASGEIQEDPGLAKMGFRTTVRSKPLMISNLRNCLARAGWKIHSPGLSDELSTFIEDPDTGKLGAADNCLDDRVMAAACALMGEARAAIRTSSNDIDKELSRVGNKNPFSMDALIAKQQRRGFGLAPRRHLRMH